MDGEALLASDNIGDNVIAVLTKLGDKPGIVRRILKRIAAGSPRVREDALTELTILAGLRRLTSEIEKEARKMPITENIMDNPLIQRIVAHKQVEFLLSQIEKRFGKVPARIRKQLATLDSDQLKAASLRIFDAQRIEDLFEK